MNEQDKNKVYIAYQGNREKGYQEALAGVLALPEMQEEQSASFNDVEMLARNSLRHQIELGIESLSTPSPKSFDNASQACTLCGADPMTANCNNAGCS